MRHLLPFVFACLALPAFAQDRVTVEGRDVLVHEPPTLAASPGLVLVLHGGGGSADTTWNQTSAGLIPFADRHGFVLAYPSAGTRWNDGRAATENGSDDVAWLRAVVDGLASSHGIDPERVFVTGLSNGGIMAYRVACEAPDLVGAIAPVAANIPQEAPACLPGGPVATLVIQGTADRLSPYAGGESLAAGRNGDPVSLMLSAWQSVNYRAQVNGCAMRARSTLLSGTAATRYDFLRCQAPVRYIEVADGGHTWPGFAPREVVGFFIAQGL